jgi:hypothetical protein
MLCTSPLTGRNLSFFAILSAIGASGCLVDDSGDTPVPRAGTGGMAAGAGGTAAGTGGTAAGAGGTGGGAGGSGGSAGMVVACSPNPDAQVCGGFVAPAWGTPPGTTAGVMIDFATYTADGKWGSTASGQLTGGTSRYHGPNDVDLTAAADAGSLRLTGSITPTGYVGIVFWFAHCVDASKFTGIAFSVGGTTGGAVMKAQIQTHVDYPVDVASSKGGCSFTDCDTRFSECAGPTYQLVVPATPAALDLPWSRFTGGVPVAEVTPDGLVGMQYQLECQANTECVFDITLGSVSLTIAPPSN